MLLGKIRKNLEEEMKSTRSAKSKKSWNCIMAALHVILVLGGLPIIYDDYYFNILETKYYYYCGCVILMLAGILGYMLLNIRFLDKLKKWKGKNFLKSLSVTDITVIAYVIISALSTLASEFKWEAFWGNEGRYSGLFLTLLYAAAYFCLTRYFEMRSWYIDLCVAAGILVCLFGITDFWGMDLLHFKENIGGQKAIFTSFIGNINTYTAIVGIYMGIVSVMWIEIKEKKKSIAYLICAWITFFAIITGKSDNAYLSIGVLFVFLPLYAMRTRRGTRRYVILLAIFFTNLKIIQWICDFFASRVSGISSLYNIILELKLLPAVIIGLWVIAGILYFVDYRTKKQDADAPRWLRWVWGGVIMIAFLTGIYILIDANAAGHIEKYQKIRGYVEFNDAWGSSRGYAWRIAIENYMKFPLTQKILGYGPDTFGLITYFNNLEEMSGTYGVLFDNAHNEYIQYLITIGPIGLGTYIAILISSFVSVVKKGLDNPCVVAIAFGCLCYWTQAFVNINQPIATPIMWTLLCMMVAWCQGKKVPKVR